VLWHSQKVLDLVATCGITKFTPYAQTPSSVPQVTSWLPLCPHMLLGSINPSPKTVTLGPTPVKPPHASLNLGVTCQSPPQPGSHQFLAALFSPDVTIRPFLSQTPGVDDFAVARGKAICQPSWNMLSTALSSRKASVAQHPHVLRSRG